MQPSPVYASIMLRHLHGGGNVAHRAFAAFEIFALPTEDNTRRLTCLVSQLLLNIHSRLNCATP